MIRESCSSTVEALFKRCLRARRRTGQYKFLPQKLYRILLAQLFALWQKQAYISVYYLGLLCVNTRKLTKVL